MDSFPLRVSRTQFVLLLFVPLDIQNPLVIPGEEVWKEALKADPQKMFGGSNTDPHKVWFWRFDW